MHRPSIEELREKLRSSKIQNRDFLVCASIPRGVPRGVICEITGTARTEWMISLLSENSDLVTFWVEDRLSILPTAIQQRGVELSRILMAEADDKLFPALRKALRSKLFDCLILPGEPQVGAFDTKMLKALQLFARESNASVFFLSRSPKQAWAIPFQIEVNWNSDRTSNPPYSVQMIKSKFSSPIEGK